MPELNEESVRALRDLLLKRAPMKTQLVIVPALNAALCKLFACEQSTCNTVAQEPMSILAMLRDINVIVDSEQVLAMANALVDHVTYDEEILGYTIEPDNWVSFFACTEQGEVYIKPSIKSPMSATFCYPLESVAEEEALAGIEQAAEVFRGFDKTLRIVSLENLTAVCRAVSTPCHVYGVVRCNPRDTYVRIAYTNPDPSTGAHLPVFGLLPLTYIAGVRMAVLRVEKVLDRRQRQMLPEMSKAFDKIINGPQMIRLSNGDWVRKEHANL